jgi:hypothetical protein
MLPKFSSWETGGLDVFCLRAGNTEGIPVVVACENIKRECCVLNCSYHQSTHKNGE